MMLRSRMVLRGMELIQQIGGASHLEKNTHVRKTKMYRTACRARPKGLRSRFSEGKSDRQSNFVTGIFCPTGASLKSSAFN